VACKPGSVPVHLAAIQAMTIHLGCLLPDTSCDTPGRRPENRSDWQASPPSLFGLAPGGVYRAVPVTGNAVRSYRTLSPLPAMVFRRRHHGRFAFCGTFPGVTPAGHYPAPCFRGARTFLDPPSWTAAIQPPDVRLALRRKATSVKNVDWARTLFRTRRHNGSQHAAGFPVGNTIHIGRPEMALEGGDYNCCGRTE
jgi:hypothetical protein